MAICNQLGWACESIQKDYGEDLCIQTTIGNKIDHHRIWFQVKATDDLSRYYSKGRQLSFPIDVGHALRWVRNLELVVLILWDIKNDVGYWTLPQDNVTDLDLFSTKKKTARIFFEKKDKFTVSAARKLSWMARIEHYMALLARAHQRVTQGQREKALGLKPSESPEYTIRLLCFDFLRTIGFFDQDGRLGEGIAQKLTTEMLAQSEVGNNKEVCARAVALVVLRQLSDTADVGLPGFLLWESVAFAGGLVDGWLRDAGLTDLPGISRSSSAGSQRSFKRKLGRKPSVSGRSRKRKGS